MKKIPAIALAAAFLIGAAALQSQNQPRPGAPPTPGALPVSNAEIQGTVVESESSAPIPRASITVRSRRDSSIVAGAIATDAGIFRILGLRPGAYMVRVATIGFKPSVQQVAITDPAQKVALGQIKLTRVAIALQSVQVNEEAATVTIAPDRNSYRAKDVAPAAAHAVDVLEATPSVTVDGEGKISLRGNENVAVQINGRPSPIRGAQLTAYLKGLPATIVERIEVIPNPSAKYDPEGMAGIINIVLKQNTDLGVSGGLNGGFASSDRFNGAGNLGYQSGGLATFSSYGINSDNRGMFGINDRERYSTLAALLSVTGQDIDEFSGNRGQNLYTSADYRLNTRDVLSNALTLNVHNNSDDMITQYSELNSSRTLYDRYIRTRDDDARGTMVDYDLALKRTFEPRKHELSSELRFNRGRDTDFLVMWRQPLTLAGAANGSLFDGETDNTVAVTKQLTGQLDYTKTLRPRRKLETGYKGNERWLDRDFLVRKDALGTGAWVASNLSNDFSFDEMVHAAYGVLSQGVGKWELQSGLRAEYADRDFTLKSTATHFPYKYTSLFPSAVAVYNKSDAVQMKVSYSRRIRRPGTQELNPFPTFFDAQNVFIGNPRLNPEYTDAIELGATRSGKLGSIQFSPFYRRTTNVIRVAINTSDTVAGREVTSISFQNLATSNSYGTDINGTLRLGPKFSGLAGVNVFKIVTDGGSTSALQSNAVAFAFRLNGTSQVTQTLLFNAAFNYRAPMKFEQGQFSAMKQFNFVIRQKVKGDAVSIALRVVDPFNSVNFRVKVGNNTLTQITERNPGIRAAFLSFQYNFGQTPKIRQQPQQPQDVRPGFPSGG